MANCVVIQTVPGDLHARAVEWALRTVHHQEAHVWLSPDYPTLSTINLELSDAGSVASYKCASFNVATTHPVSFWRRREGLPVFESGLHPADKVPAQTESKQFLDGLSYTCDGEFAFSANPYAGALRARNKAAQLREAISSKLRVPRTLMSSDAEAIRTFCAENGGSIIKSFSSPVWITEDTCFYVYSSNVSQELLADTRSLSAVPAIYQESIKKKFEVRTLFMGHEHVSVCILSQKDEKSREDWRRVRTKHVSVEPFTLPDEVAAKCIEVMKRLGIVCGSFDLAVTPDDEYVFFEVNEQGQFLWMEQKLPELPVLDMFAQFLVAGSESFRYRPQKSAARLADYLESGAWEAAVMSERALSVPYKHKLPIEELQRQPEISA